MTISASPAAAGTQVTHSETAQAGAPSSHYTPTDALRLSSADVKTKPLVKVIGQSVLSSGAATSPGNEVSEPPLPRRRASQSLDCKSLQQMTIEQLQQRVQALQLLTHRRRESYIQAKDCEEVASAAETAAQDNTVAPKRRETTGSKQEAQSSLKMLDATRTELRQRMVAELTLVVEKYIKKLSQLPAHLAQDANREFFPKFVAILNLSGESNTLRVSAEEELSRLLGTHYKDFCFFCKRPLFLKYFERQKRITTAASTSNVKGKAESGQQAEEVWAQETLFAFHIEEDKAACIAYALELDIEDYQLKLGSAPRKVDAFMNSTMNAKSILLYKTFIQSFIKNDTQFNVGINKIFLQLQQPGCSIHELQQLFTEIDPTVVRSSSAASTAAAHSAFQSRRNSALEIVEAFLNEWVEFFCRLNNKTVYNLHENFRGAICLFLSDKKPATFNNTKEANFFLLALFIRQLLLPLLFHKQNELLAQAQSIQPTLKKAFEATCGNLNLVLQLAINLIDFLSGGEKKLPFDLDFKKRPQMVCILQDLEASLQGREPLHFGIQQIKPDTDIDQLDFVWWAVHAPQLIKNAAKIKAGFLQCTQSELLTQKFDALVIRATLVVKMIQDWRVGLPADLSAYFVRLAPSLEDKIVSITFVSSFRVIEAVIGGEKAKMLHEEYVMHCASLFGKNKVILDKFLVKTAIINPSSLITLLSKRLFSITEALGGVSQAENFIVSLLLPELIDQVREDRIDLAFWKKNFGVVQSNNSYLEQIEKSLLSSAELSIRYRGILDEILPKPKSSSSSARAADLKTKK